MTDFSQRWGRTASIFIFLVVWQIASALLQSDVLPSPIVVAQSLWQHAIHGDLFYQLGITLLRVLASFIIAMALGTLIGVLMGKSKSADAWMDSILVLMLNIPALVTMILCYIWFGLTEVAAVLAVVINKVPTVVVTLREGARAVDKSLMQVAQVFRLSPVKTFSKVYLPQLYPYLMAAARSGLALIWKIVLVVELLGRSNGVGFQLHSYFQFFDIASILAYTIAFATIILLLEQFVMRPLDNYIARGRT